MIVEVDMEVSRYFIHARDSVVELWGHVGDYEVMTMMSLRDAHDKCIISDDEYEISLRIINAFPDSGGVRTGSQQCGLAHRPARARRAT